MLYSEILQQCTEKDVEQLCAELELNLLDKLKLKTALKSVNIPKESVQYAVINENEQNAILQIHQSIKQAQDLIIQNNVSYPNKNSLENELSAEKQKISSVFDAFHQAINEKKEYILNLLEQNFEHKNTQTKQLAEYLETANDAKSKCQQLILNKNVMSDFRNQSIVDLKDQTLAKLAKIIQTNTKMEIAIDGNMQSLNDCIDSLVVVKYENDKNVTFDTDRTRKGETYSDCKNDENINHLNQQSHSFSNKSDASWKHKPKQFGSFDASQNFKADDLCKKAVQKIESTADNRF